MANFFFIDIAAYRFGNVLIWRNTVLTILQEKFFLEMSLKLLLAPAVRWIVWLLQMKYDNPFSCKCNVNSFDLSLLYAIVQFTLTLLRCLDEHLNFERPASLTFDVHINVSIITAVFARWNE